MSSKHYEYKLHYMIFDSEPSREEQLIGALNTFGQDGWRVNRLSGELSWRNIMSWKGGLNLLVERETDVDD